MKMHKQIHTLGKNILILGMVFIPQLLLAGGPNLSWTGAGGSTSSPIEEWFNQIISVIMLIFVMTAIVMGSLAFKQLASDGNWKDFWSKIAGAMGMFVVPIVIYWIRSNSAAT